MAILGLVGAVVAACVVDYLGGAGAPLPMSGMLRTLLLLEKPIWGVPVAVTLLAACYFGWLRPVMRAKVAFTPRTWAAVWFFAALSVLWYWEGWSYGMQWQGPAYTLGCACISACLLLLIAAFGGLSRALGDPDLAAAGRWLAVFWAVTYGFPWLGESP